MQLLCKVIKSDQVSEGQIEKLVIRGAGQPTADSPQRKKILDSAKAEAEKIVVEAEARAKEMLAQAKNEAEELLKSSKDTGYQEGYQSALQQAAGEAEKIRQEAKDVLNTAYKENKQLIQDSEEDIRRLVYSLTEKLVLEQVKVDEEMACRMIRQALTQMCESKDYQIYVNPEEVEIVKQQKENIRELLPNGTGMAIVGDPGVNKGSCRVVTEKAVADATLDAKLEGLKQFLLEA